MAKIITVTIDEETAETSVDLAGFHGKGCAEVLKAFEGLGKITKQGKKPEFFQQQQNTQRK